MFCLVIKCHHKSCWQLIVFMSSVLFNFIETKTRANVHLMKRSKYLFLFWQIFKVTVMLFQLRWSSQQAWGASSASASSWSGSVCVFRASEKVKRTDFMNNHEEALWVNVRHHFPAWLRDSKIVINHLCWCFQWGKPLRDSRKVSRPWRQKECASPWSRCWVSDECNDVPFTFIKLINAII